MIGQKTLYSFFSPSPARKRRACSPEPADPGTGVAAVAETGDAAASPAKKTRAEQEEPGTPPSSPLSPEQLVRIQRNKAAALLRLAARNVPVGFGESWKKPLSGEFGKPYFIKVKVVILGQDPYHGPNQAHGLCFSVQRPVPPPPRLYVIHMCAVGAWTFENCASDSVVFVFVFVFLFVFVFVFSFRLAFSLENIYKELSADIDGFVHPGHGDLSGWAKQGVLLLNAVLTVRAHQANSHKERGWEQFTDAVVSWLNQNSSGLVFLLWGSYAQKKGSAIDRKRHHVLQTAHPSPFSVHRGFFGCRHFSKTNELLRKSGKGPINWKDL
ncbi:Uracil-DNA glycosylase [Camelus dromedarius]|uniref:Uracil-DNA glycosylase n=1 Tax=Camelus dromedarius TaxID=9838 RepID=A0A5N4C9P4_CAMDR|nr:Uracil-DNA glycosylase [Camelus dromedarius]